MSRQVYIDRHIIYQEGQRDFERKTNSTVVVILGDLGNWEYERKHGNGAKSQYHNEHAENVLSISPLRPSVVPHNVDALNKEKIHENFVYHVEDKTEEY